MNPYANYPGYGYYQQQAQGMYPGYPLQPQAGTPMQQPGYYPYPQAPYPGMPMPGMPMHQPVHPYAHIVQTKPQQPAQPTTPQSKTSSTQVVIPPAVQHITDLLTMVFVSKIPKTMSNESVQGMLSVCGEVRQWKSLTDTNGKFLGTVFCVYETVEGVLAAFELLGGTKPFQNSSEESKEEPKETEEGEAEDEDKNKGILIVTADQITLGHLKSASENLMDQDLSKQAEQLKPYFQEIQKGRASQFMFSLAEGDDEKPERTQREIESDEEDEAEEIRRNDRREQDKLAQFQERERRYELSESARIRKVAIDIQGDLDHEERRRKTREYLSKKLADFDDDVERDRGEEEFFRDRERWWAKRQRDRQREVDYDNRDRQAEQDERSFAAEAERESAARAAEAKAKETVDGFVVSRIMTKEERVEAIQKLVAEIPTDKEGLWQWNINWQYLDDVIVNGKLRPFLAKKVVEFVGNEQNDLVDFVLEKIKGQADAESITKELVPLMEEEAEVFVMKLWRMVIYETEARSKGL